MANKAISSLAVGSSVYLNVGGTRTEFLVVHQGNPHAGRYDASCDGTWILAKNCPVLRQINASGTNSYASGAVDSYLEGDFYNSFDDVAKSAIKQVKIPYVDSNKSVKTRSNGLSRKVFLLSGPELGMNHTNMLSGEGYRLSYFPSSTVAADKRVSNWNGAPVFYWTRSPDTGSTTNMWAVSETGALTEAGVTNWKGVRPALILSSDTLVDGNGNVTLPVDLTAHKTLINGTAYTVKSGKCMVNGTVYNILKGRTLIDGTGWDITLPSVGTKLSTLDVGQSVFANVNGKKTEFLVVHQGKPSSMYDASCNGTWLLMKDIYENRKWHSSNVNKYETSDINTYLNGPFFNLFDSNVQGIIKQVKLPYRKGGGSGGTDQSGANGLLCKVFLLSGPEVGLGDLTYMPNDGAKLTYFESGTSTVAKKKRVAYLNGSATIWWLRSQYTSNASRVLLVYQNGSYGSNDASGSFGVRPALVLPPDALVDDEFNLIA